MARSRRFIRLRGHTYTGTEGNAILIDVTGGQKTNSIAAAVVALSEGRNIQYVSYNWAENTCTVVAYDVTYDN